MDRIILSLPGKQDRGFFRFLRGYATFAEVMTKPASHTPEEIDQAVDWLASLVKQPRDRRKVRDLLMDMSAAEIEEMIAQFSESASVETDPKPSG